MEVQAIHINIPKEQYEFMQQFKKDMGVDMTEFIVTAVKEKINQIKELQDATS